MAVNLKSIHVGGFRSQATCFWTKKCPQVRNIKAAKTLSKNLYYRFHNRIVFKIFTRVVVMSYFVICTSEFTNSLLESHYARDYMLCMYIYTLCYTIHYAIQGVLIRMYLFIYYFLGVFKLFFFAFLGPYNNEGL